MLVFLAERNVSQSIEHSNCIIVGGGPAGSSAAKVLRENGKDVLLLDKADFPREKPCGGGVVGEVFEKLNVSPMAYPHSMTRAAFFGYSRSGLPVYVAPFIPLPKFHVYSVRRCEFDRWLLELAGVPVRKHKVKKVTKQGGLFLLDDRYTCRHLIGAGGERCPVRRAFFGDHYTSEDTGIFLAMEKEIEEPYPKSTFGHYFPRFGDIPGYGWFFPKENHINVGIGGLTHEGDLHIRKRYLDFIYSLEERRLISSQNVNDLKDARGFHYRIANRNSPVRRDNCYIVGDAAGLASLDYGEGIRQAVLSGMAAASNILGKATYERKRIPKYSIPISPINRAVPGYMGWGN